MDAELLVSSREQHGIELLGPPRAAQSWQARAGGYDQSRFSLDWDKQQAACPEGKVSHSWATYQRKPESRRKPDGHSPDNRSVVTVRFAARNCPACASRDKYVRSTEGQPRTRLLPERA